MKLSTSLLLVVFGLLNLNACKYQGAREGIPDQIRVMFVDDPSITMTIGWQHYSDGADEEEFLAYDTVDHGQDVNAYTHHIKVQRRTDYKGVKTSFVKLDGLDANTRYYFVIKNEFGVSKRYYTHTLPDNKDERISIISGGDSRNNRTPRKAANLLVAKLKPHFVYFGGDMVNLGFGTEWHDWLEDWQMTIGADGRVTPLVTARGNHERGNYILEDLFWLPESNYYALTVAGGLIRAYVLNSESAVVGDQTNWLVSDLEQHQDANWRIAIYHKPIRPHVAKKSEGTNTYNYWAPAFHKYNVNLVVESDAHTVKQTYPIRPSTEEGSVEGYIRDDETGTVYVGEGCWGAPLRAANDTKAWTRDSGSFNQFKWIFVDQDKIEVRTVKVDNAEEVGEVDSKSRFAIPANLDVWAPANGSVVTIQ